jgi:hypothetical protein
MSLLEVSTVLRSTRCVRQMKAQSGRWNAGIPAEQLLLLIAGTRLRRQLLIPIRKIPPRCSINIRSPDARMVRRHDFFYIPEFG